MSKNTPAKRDSLFGIRVTIGVMFGLIIILYWFLIMGIHYFFTIIDVIDSLNKNIMSLDEKTSILAKALSYIKDFFNLGQGTSL